LLRYEKKTFVASAVDAGEWSISRPGRFTPPGKNGGTHWVGGWVGSAVGLDVKKMTCPWQNLNPELSNR